MKEKIELIFQAVPQRHMFAGHYHRWLMATPNGMTDWAGDKEVRLVEPDRYVIVIGPSANSLLER